MVLFFTLLIYARYELVFNCVPNCFNPLPSKPIVHVSVKSRPIKLSVSAKNKYVGFGARHQLKDIVHQ